MMTYHGDLAQMVLALAACISQPGQLEMPDVYFPLKRLFAELNEILYWRHRHQRLCDVQNIKVLTLRLSGWNGNQIHIKLCQEYFEESERCKRQIEKLPFAEA